jgi:hypothetical protein
LKEEERVNVLLTRARIGMYIVGNLQHFVHCGNARGRRLWSEIKRLLDEENRVMRVFPAWCERHKLLTEVPTPDAFPTQGGCSLPSLRRQASVWPRMPPSMPHAKYCSRRRNAPMQGTSGRHMPLRTSADTNVRWPGPSVYQTGDMDMHPGPSAPGRV